MLVLSGSFRRGPGIPPGRPGRAAFSLVEVMIAMVILALGLTMVASIFPVGWHRARTLSEHTTRITMTANAEALIKATVHPSGLSTRDRLGYPTNAPRLDSGGLAGDLFYDPTLVEYGAGSILKYSDTRVHALNLENRYVEGGRHGTTEFVAEDPWELELIADFRRFPVHPGQDLGLNFGERSFFEPQLRFHERIHPPLDPFPEATAAAQPRWLDRLSTRRFCWAVLHRFRGIVGPRRSIATTDAESRSQQQAAARAIGSERVLEMYYVTLRRPPSTARFARQDPNEAFLPDPSELTLGPVRVAALDSVEDVVLPVPWRVQVEFPDTIGQVASGIPTEVQVPPEDMPGGPSVHAMVVQMFPVGAQFIDELTGAVYRVTDRRFADNSVEKAFLKLDREVLLRDVDRPADDPLYEPTVSRVGFLDDPDELIRTVWVFPPAAQAERAAVGVPVFDGAQPVVAIDVGTLRLTPPN
jgi:prepilin-type N-terminal cleavage/methylation domain-containing protein